MDMNRIESVGRIVFAAVAFFAAGACAQISPSSSPRETAAHFQSKIDAAAAKGGGRVTVPAGAWTCGTLWLKSGVELHLAEGAVLKASGDLADYNAEDAYGQNWGSKAESWRGHHLIIAHEIQNASITGPGTIDGNGRAFFAKEPGGFGIVTWRRGSITTADRAAARRPGQLVVFIECRNVRVENVNFVDSPCWTVFFHGCDRVRAKGLKIRSDLRHQNTDGVDIDSCSDVFVSDCDVETGDDCFTVRGADRRLKAKNKVCENVRFENCRGACSACGIRVGVGNGTIRNVSFSNIVFTTAGRGIALQCSYSGKGQKGADISNVRFSDIKIRDASIGVLVTGGAGAPWAKLEDISFSRLDVEAHQPVEIRAAGKTVPERIVFEDFRYSVKDLPKMPARVADIFVGEGVGRVTVNGKAVSGKAMSADVVSVADFGAVGDGKTDDTAAIMKAYDAAARGEGTLFFPKNSKGSTYLTRRSIILRSGMTVSSDRGVVLSSASAVLEGGGRTIRRKVVKDSPKGATSVEVDDAAGLVPGQEITIWQSEGSYRETLADIVKVEGNTVHFDTSRFSKDGVNRGNLHDRIGGKAVVLTDFSFVKTVMSKEAVDCAVENITIRSRGNPTDPYIYTISPVHQAPNRPAAQKILRIRNVTIDGSSQDGISVQGSGDIWIENCTVRNVKHKGIHWGTSCDRVIVRDNLCENCGGAEFEKSSNNGGTGAMYFCVNNHRVLITGNVIKNCYRGVFGYDYRGNGETDTDSVVADNVFDNCATYGCLIHGGRRLVVADNVFRNFSREALPIAVRGERQKRRLLMTGLDTGVIDGNVFVDCAVTGRCVSVHESAKRVAVGREERPAAAPQTAEREPARPGRVDVRKECIVLTGKNVVLEDAYVTVAQGPTLVIENTENAVVKASFFSSKKGTAIEIRGTNRNLVIEGCHITDSHRGIVAGPGSQDATIRWCTVQNCAAAGIDLKGERFTVRGNVFASFDKKSQPVALALKDSEFSANTVAGFRSTYANANGVIRLEGSENIRLHANVITGDKGAFNASFKVNFGGAKGVKEENCVFGALDPRILTGDGVLAYRDPAVFFDGKRYHLFCTVVSTWKDGPVYSQLYTMSTGDFSSWRGQSFITGKDQKLNFSSPGNVIKFGGEHILCCCSYPRPGYMPTDKVRWADDTARCYIMRKGIKDKQWGKPELLKLKGDNVGFAEMGRMIDPYLVEDPKTPGKWWCFFKQGGIARSWTRDFKTWHYDGKMKGGENVSIIRKDDGNFLMFHSPSDGIGIKESDDLVNWKDIGMAQIEGRGNWPWAKGRLTAGAVIDCRKNPRVGKYVMFFHGSGPLGELEGDFDRNASIAMVVSDDLIHWK